MRVTEIGAAAPGLPIVRGRRARLALAFAAGALMTAGHPPIGLPWALFVAVPVLVWLVATAPTARAAAAVGWVAGFGYFVTVLHWIGNAFLVDPDQFALLMPFGVLLFPAGLALLWAAAFAAARRLWPGGVSGAPAGVPGNMPGGTLLLAALWTAAEAVRSYALTGFPWALPGYVWVDLAPMQAAAWVGPFGMTLLTLALCGLPLLAALQRRWGVAALALAAGGAIWAAGAARLPEATAYRPDAPVVRVVQPNAPQHLKFVPGHREEFYRRTLAATAAPPDPAPRAARDRRLAGDGRALRARGPAGRGRPHRRGRGGRDRHPRRVPCRARPGWRPLDQRAGDGAARWLARGPL